MGIENLIPGKKSLQYKHSYGIIWFFFESKEILSIRLVKEDPPKDPSILATPCPAWPFEIDRLKE
ncbi:hypothetical protein BG32_10285 [Mesotoga sp. HF07.pep.5.2.highcov]|nr:hypothetical protein BG32_10285 [Mesotoga sp. HF07.pep.5.2.highcov]